MPIHVKKFKTRKGKPLNPEQVEIIKSLYALGKNRQEIADMCGISWATVQNCLKMEEKEVEELRAVKRQEFIEACWQSINQAVALGNSEVAWAQKINREADELEKRLKAEGASEREVAAQVKAVRSLSSTPLSQISTYIGTLYDKQALAKGDPTEIKRGIVSWDDLD